MTKVYIAFYKGKARKGASLREKRHHFWDGLIRLFTRSPYSHCEIAFLRTDGRFLCFGASAREGGLRAKIMPLNSERWDLLPAPNVLAQELLMQSIGAGYDWLGVLRFLLPFLPQSPHRWFCSEYVAAQLSLPEPHRYSPHKLWQHLTTASQNKEPT